MWFRSTNSLPLLPSCPYSYFAISKLDLLGFKAVLRNIFICWCFYGHCRMSSFVFSFSFLIKNIFGLSSFLTLWDFFPLNFSQDVSLLFRIGQYQNNSKKASNGKFQEPPLIIPKQPVTRAPFSHLFILKSSPSCSCSTFYWEDGNMNTVSNLFIIPDSFSGFPSDYPKYETPLNYFYLFVFFGPYRLTCLGNTYWLLHFITGHGL